MASAARRRPSLTRCQSNGGSLCERGGLDGTTVALAKTAACVATYLKACRHPLAVC